MVAKTFGNYAVSVFNFESTPYAIGMLTGAVSFFFILLNFVGSKAVSNAEGIILVTKDIILTVFMIAGLTYVDWNSFAPAAYPETQRFFGSIAITYLAFTGFSGHCDHCWRNGQSEKRTDESHSACHRFHHDSQRGLGLSCFLETNHRVC